MQQEEAVLRLIEQLCWEAVQIMLTKNLINPDFESYKKALESPDELYSQGRKPKLVSNVSLLYSIIYT